VQETQKKHKAGGHAELENIYHGVKETKKSKKTDLKSKKHIGSENAQGSGADMIRRDANAQQTEGRGGTRNLAAAQPGTKLSARCGGEA